MTQPYIKPGLFYSFLKQTVYEYITLFVRQKQTFPQNTFKHSTRTHSLATHRCSLRGRYRCTLPLCGHTPLRSDRGWSSTGWSLSHSNHPWIPLGSGSVVLRWGGWAGTRWRVRRWRGQSCWNAALRCTSCSSGKAPASTRCHQTGGPGAIAEETYTV